MEDKKIKILYLVNSSEIGGAEKSLLTLIDGLKKNNFKIHFIFLRGKGLFTEKVEEIGIPFYVFDLRKNPFLVFTVYKKIKKISPDILHSFLFISNIIGRILGKIAGIKIIISSQRSEDKWRKWYHWMIDGLTSRFATLIISNSYIGKEILVKKARINKNKIVVIPNGVKLPDRKVSTKKDFGIEEKEKVIGTVGNLRKAKNHESFLKIAKEISKTFLNTKFIIAGKGPLESYLKQLTKELSLEQKVIFTGFIREIDRIYNALDIFVLTSLWEGCPLSVLEAMSFGIPVVSFPVGDVPYIIENGKDGFVTQSMSEKEMIEKISFLLLNQGVRKKVGENAVKKIKRCFTHKKMIESYIHIYKKLVDDNVLKR